MMGFDEWSELVNGVDLIDATFARREAHLCFLWSRMRAVDDGSIIARREQVCPHAHTQPLPRAHAHPLRHTPHRTHTPCMFCVSLLAAQRSAHLHMHPPRGVGDTSKAVECCGDLVSDSMSEPVRSIPTRQVNLHFEDFLEALVRVSMMKSMPTNEEVEEGGYADGGELLLALKEQPDQYDRWLAEHQPALDLDRPFAQLALPVEYMVECLATLLVRTIEGAVSQTSNMIVNRKECDKYRALPASRRKPAAETPSPGTRLQRQPTSAALKAPK